MPLIEKPGMRPVRMGDLQAALVRRADGTTIVGWGFSPDEKPFAWVAVIPEPTMWPLLAIGLLVLVRRVNRL